MSQFEGAKTSATTPSVRISPGDAAGYISFLICGNNGQRHKASAYSFHGPRMGRSSRRLASTSLMKASWAESHRSFRPNLIAICCR